MKRTTWATVALLSFVVIVVTLGPGGIGKAAAAQARQTQAREVPTFQVDPPGRSFQASGAADVTVYPKTNEVFVADGYGNRRVIVFDADTGAFKRMWGAFGNVPTDPPPSRGRGPGAGSDPAAQDDEGPGAPQFNSVHSARVSNDGLVYVSDPANKRVQVFTPEGTYVTQVFLSRGKIPPSTLPGFSTARRSRSWAHSETGRARRPGGSTLSTTYPWIRRATPTPLKSITSGTDDPESSSSRECR